MLHYLSTLAPQAPALFRQVAGYSFLMVGILGSALPIIPGWPGIILAVAILGRRDRALRHLNLLLRRSLRTMRRARPQAIRRTGWQLATQYRTVRRTLRPHIIRAEQIFGAR